MGIYRKPDGDRIAEAIRETALIIPIGWKEMGSVLGITTAIVPEYLLTPAINGYPGIAF
jgi:hypothetical protein